MEPKETNEPPQEEAYHLTGDKLGKFVILGELGRGSMGVVYEAFQEGVKRKVALKVLPANITLDDKHVERFHREAEAVGKLNHPHIIQIYDNDQIVERTGEKVHKTHYFAMEMVEGADFGEIRCHDRASILRVARLIRDAARALAHAHAQGVIHRDIKPSNLLVDKSDRVVVTDFGLARIKDSASLTSTDAIVGTPKYMAPEQVLASSKSIDGRADVYSLGATLFHAIAGRPPLEAPSIQAYFKAIIEERPVSPRKLNKDCPLDLATIVLRCLEKEPKDRYANADALADDIDRFLEGKRILARPRSTVQRAAGWVQRHKVITTLGAFAIVALAVTLSLSGQVRQASKRVRIEQRARELRNEEDVAVAIVEALELADRYPGDPAVKELIAFLYGRKADQHIEAGAGINWLELTADLERAGRKDDAWYLMGLCELGRTNDARAAAERLPEDKVERVLTLGRLTLEGGDPKGAIDLLADVPEPRPPFVVLILARAHQTMAAANANTKTVHLQRARTLLRGALARVNRLWLRHEIQYLLYHVRRGLGEQVSLRDSVDDFTIVANRWWSQVSDVWDGMTKGDVDNLKVYVQVVLSLAKLSDAFGAEIEKHAREWIARPRAREKVIGHLLLGVARLSARDEAARDAFTKAENWVEQDSPEEALLPYAYWGKSLAELAQGDLRGAITNAGLALQEGPRFEHLETVAAYIEALHADAREQKNAIEEKHARDTLTERLKEISPRPAWITALLARLARASSSAAPD